MRHEYNVPEKKLVALSVICCKPQQVIVDTCYHYLTQVYQLMPGFNHIHLTRHTINLIMQLDFTGVSTPIPTLISRETNPKGCFSTDVVEGQFPDLQYDYGRLHSVWAAHHSLHVYHIRISLRWRQFLCPLLDLLHQ